MERIEIRTINNIEELEQVYELWETVFPENKIFFQERLELGSDYDMNTTWIAKVNGTIAASVQIFPYYFHYRNTILKVGGIGNVATLPNFRGKGLTQTILKRQTEWMDKNDFDLSLLSTGINHFYEKVGWKTVPYNTYIVRNVPEIQDFQYGIEEFSISDLEELKMLYDEFSRNYIGIRIRSAAYWEGQLQKKDGNLKKFIVAKMNNEVVAYLRYGVSAGNITIEECCYQESHEDAALTLLKELITRNKGYESIRSSLADNHELTRYFKVWDAEIAVETANMWKIINSKRLMGKLKDVFSQNIPHINYSLLFQVGHTDFLLTKKEGIVDVKIPTESFYYNELVKYSDSEFIKMLLNGSEVNKQNECLIDVFPKGLYQFWATDSF